MKKRFFYTGVLVTVMSIVAGCRKEESAMIPDGAYMGLMKKHTMVVDPGNGYYFKDSVYASIIVVRNTRDSIIFEIDGMEMDRFRREEATSYSYQYNVWFYRNYDYVKAGHALRYNATSFISGLNEPSGKSDFTGTSE